MSRWFRFYDDAVNDPKVQRLPGEKFKAWVNLLCIASSNEGALPCLADIAFSLRITEDAASCLLDEFCSIGLMDPIEVANAPMSYEPHNWNVRQYKSDVSTDRVKRFRNGKRNVSETSPETEQIQITEQKEDAAANAAPSKMPEDPQVPVFRRSKELFGHKAGGQIANQLLKAKGGLTNHAMSALELAAGKEDPRKYIFGVIKNGSDPPNARPDLSW